MSSSVAPHRANHAVAINTGAAGPRQSRPAPKKTLDQEGRETNVRGTPPYSYSKNYRPFSVLQITVDFAVAALSFFRRQNASEDAYAD